MIYLASRSPRRQLLLKNAGLRFKVKHPNYHEKPIPGAGPSKLVSTHALQKALSLAPKIKEGTILGADTIVYFKKKVIGKPRDLKHALSTLSNLQGKWHTVFTGVALIQVKNHQVLSKTVFYEKTKVKIRAMSQADIVKYFKKIQPLDKAGAYAIQSKHAGIVEQIKGSFSNAVGLPMEKLCVKIPRYGR